MRSTYQRVPCRALAFATIALAVSLPLHAQGNPRSAALLLLATHLEADAATDPLGIDDPAPRLSWHLESPRRGVMQSAYRILVATRPELLREGRADLWDSNDIPSAEPWALYQGRPLTSRT